MDLDKQACYYHSFPTKGKLEVTPTKPLATQKDLSLAYSPGVGAVCREIDHNPELIYEYTAKGNLVAVISNGTAVLGLGDIGPEAGKPVMEGKAVLFKNFANIDVFDIEVDAKDPDRFIDVVSALEPTFGGINLEDIKAPDCFKIEAELKEKMGIPVFHDDQHGTAIVVSAAITNALELVSKDIRKIKLVTSGAGAAAIACLDLLCSLGLKRENIYITDIDGVIYEGRPGNDKLHAKQLYYAQKTNARLLNDVIDKADVFLGLSAPNVLKEIMLKKMAKSPIIMALANPIPEIMPEIAKRVRPDAIIATGRSDYPNQVNNVICFPFLFRGTLDVQATTINQEMKIAAVKAIAKLAKAESSDIVQAAYGIKNTQFGSEYIIPKPFDPRLICTIAPAVAQAAIDSGVAKKPFESIEEYTNHLTQFVYRTTTLMQPVFTSAAEDPKRIVYAEGEDERTLRAAQMVREEGLAFPILIGREAVVEKRIKQFGLRLQKDRDFELCDPEDDPRYHDYWTHYHRLMERKGVSPGLAKHVIRTNTTAIAAMMVKRAEADSMIAGTVGQYKDHLETIINIIGLAPGIRRPSAMNGIIFPTQSVFMCDTHVNPDPSAEEIAEMTLMAAAELQKFGITPKIALLSHSNFGTRNNKSAQKMRAAKILINELDPSLEVEGEMHADLAFLDKSREKIFPNSALKGKANLLIMPNLDASNISYSLLTSLAHALSIGPILMGLSQPAHLLSTSASTRTILNMSALAVVDAQMYTKKANKKN